MDTAKTPHVLLNLMAPVAGNLAANADVTPYDPLVKIVVMSFLLSFCRRERGDVMDSGGGA
jgi:hypothetical protein